jgi:hypothetical protein
MALAWLMLFSWRVAAQDAGTGASGTWQLLVALDFATRHKVQDRSMRLRLVSGTLCTASGGDASRPSICDVVRLIYHITAPHSEPRPLYSLLPGGGIFPLMYLPEIPDPFEQVLVR